MAGRANPLPGLTGLGSRALPALISPVSGSSLVVYGAGTPTNGRWNPNDKSADITLSNDDRTAVNPATVGYRGVRGTRAFDTTSLIPMYAEIVVDNIGTGGNDNWRIGFCDAASTLAASPDSVYALAGSIATNAVRAATTSGTDPWNVKGNYAIANGDTVQLLILGGSFWWGLNGSMSGFSVTDITSSPLANYTGITQKAMYLCAYLFNTTPNSQVTIPPFTAYAAPAGAMVY